MSVKVHKLMSSNFLLIIIYLFHSNYEIVATLNKDKSWISFHISCEANFLVIIICNLFVSIPAWYIISPAIQAENLYNLIEIAFNDSFHKTGNWIISVKLSCVSRRLSDEVSCRFLRSKFMVRLMFAVNNCETSWIKRLKRLN